jgi:hypothetical protein
MRPDDASQSRSSDMLVRYAGQERRAYPRIETPFRATVRSVDVDDQRFEEHTVLDNLSSCGLYLRLSRWVQQGIRLFVLIRLSATPYADGFAACIALHGVALRTELRPGGVFGTAIRVTNHRFLNATAPAIAHGVVRWPDSLGSSD